MFANKPVAKLEDLRGVRLITESSVTVKQFNFFDTAKIHKGFTHEILTMAANETAGCIAPAENYILWNLERLVPYITIAPLSSTYITIAISEKSGKRCLPKYGNKLWMFAVGRLHGGIATLMPIILQNC